MSPTALSADGDRASNSIRWWRSRTTGTPSRAQRYSANTAGAIYSYQPAGTNQPTTTQTLVPAQTARARTVHERGHGVLRSGQHRRNIGTGRQTRPETHEHGGRTAAALGVAVPLGCAGMQRLQTACSRTTVHYRGSTHGCWRDRTAERVTQSDPSQRKLCGLGIAHVQLAPGVSHGVAQTECVAGWTCCSDCSHT